MAEKTDLKSVQYGFESHHPHVNFLLQRFSTKNNDKFCLVLEGISDNIVDGTVHIVCEKRPDEVVDCLKKLAVDAHDLIGDIADY